MAGTEITACPNCGHQNVMNTVRDGIRHYYCVMCTEEYYTPDECTTDQERKNEN